MTIHNTLTSTCLERLIFITVGMPDSLCDTQGHQPDQGIVTKRSSRTAIPPSSNKSSYSCTLGTLALAFDIRFQGMFLLPSFIVLECIYRSVEVPIALLEIKRGNIIPKRKTKTNQQPSATGKASHFVHNSLGNLACYHPSSQFVLFNLFLFSFCRLR